MCGEAALCLTFCLVSWCIFSKMSWRQEKSVGGSVDGGLFRFLVSWLTHSHMTRKRRWCGLASVLRDPCLTTQTCNLIYPISGAGIEAPVVMRTDRRTGCFIKEAFMSRVLKALAVFLWLIFVQITRPLYAVKRLGPQSSWKLCEQIILRETRPPGMLLKIECLTGIGSRLCNWRGGGVFKERGSRVWKWERTGEAVDLSLFRKQMWVRSMMQRGPGLQSQVF